MSTNNFDEIIKSQTPTLVDFFATWCGPCRVMGPVLEELKQRVGDKATILKVDIDQNQALAMRYNVRSVPTLIMFKGGEAVWRTVGVQDISLLEAKIAEHDKTKGDEA